MYEVPTCNVCGEAKRTVVCEYNRLIFHDSMWASDLARYDYALCHGCGIVYSTRRPDREEYEFLYKNFNEFLLRPEKITHAEVLSEEVTQGIDDRYLPWWELGTRSGTDRLRGDFVKSMEYLPHIVSAVNVEGGSVLAIRAKSSTLVDVLRRVFGAKLTHVTTMFPSHKYLCEKNEGVKAICDVDFDDFRIPFDQKYDLIIENHLLVHMIDAKKTFSELIDHLNDGGVIFLRNELDDTRLFNKSKNLFAELRPFHFNQFDIPTLERMLRCFGFEPINLALKVKQKSEIMGAARFKGDGNKEFEPVSRSDLNARLQMYAQWRDESILSLPKERCQALFGDEVRRVWQRLDDRLKGQRFKPMQLLRKFDEAGVPKAELELYAQSGRPTVVKPSLGWRSKLLNRVALVTAGRQKKRASRIARTARSN